MKALSIRQPWASLLVDGHKVYEYRSRDFHHRGLVAIHASKTVGVPERKGLANPEVEAWLKTVGDPPKGAVIAIGWLVETRFLTERAARTIKHDHPGEKIWGKPVQSWYALEFDIRPLRRPVVATGALGLWNWSVPARVKAEVDEISRQLTERNEHAVAR
jgi:hypothetical protein